MTTLKISNFANIQTAVDACPAEGGRIIVSSGVWNSKVLHLKSNVHIVLEEGAEIIFSADPRDYLPAVFTRWEGTECYNYSPLIYARGCKNISITGKGVLNGNGGAWWKWKELQQTAAFELSRAECEGIPVNERIYASEEAALRPSFIQLLECSDILLEGFTIKEGPQWTIHPVYCSNVIIRNLRVVTSGPNTDGCNPDSCRNVLIDGCSFETGDDCIAINAGMNEDGMRVARPCENIEIKNCTMRGGHGAIVIGSAVSGGVKNVCAHDCTIDGTMWGIRIKSMRGRGGFVENAHFRNIEINNTTEQAIVVSMFYEYSTVAPAGTELTDCKNISFADIRGRNNRLALRIRGFKENPIQNITLTDVDINAAEAGDISGAEGILFEGVIYHNKS